MLRIRPVKTDDHAAILALAQQAGIGFTSLPADAQVLEHKIQNAVASFAGNPERANEEVFLFVLEDTEHKRLAGTVGIYAHVGLSRPFYSYKLSTIVQASHMVNVYSRHRVLHMVNDYTGASEVGSLFLHPDYRRDGIGKFLSRARFLMFAEFPDLFSDLVISEIRGVQDANGHSPFYDNLAKHFFQMEFRQADYINATQGGQFISDLMPKYPIYVELLSQEAQAVIGEAFEASRPAKHMLELEGFRHEGYLDVFDAGPTIQAERKRIRTVRESHHATVKEVLKEPAGDGVERCIVSNTRLGDFSICRDALIVHEARSVSISTATAAALGVEKGDAVRYVKA